MKAAQIYGERDLRVDTLADPKPASDEALIRIQACGVCPSDVKSYLGKAVEQVLPRMPGHEWSGTVLALGEEGKNSQFKVGDRVVVDWRYVCGHCHQCHRGAFNYCENRRKRVRGGFAEIGIAPLTQLRVIPDRVSFEAAAFTEPLACVIQAHSYTKIELGDDVVIIGAGPMGLLHLQVALRRGARVIVSEQIASRLEKARELGAHDVIDASTTDPIAQVKELTQGRGANTVIVAIGGFEPTRQGLEMAAINGWVNLFAGTYPRTEVPVDPNLIHYRQLRVTGSHDFTPHHFTAALRLIEFGIVDVESTISHRFDLDDVREAFETTAGRFGLKSMVCPIH